ATVTGVQTCALPIFAGLKKTIVGVLPPGFSVFSWDTPVDVWLSIVPPWSTKIRWLPKIGRLKPGVTLVQAQAELNAIASGMNERSEERRVGKEGSDE